MNQNGEPPYDTMEKIVMSVMDKRVARVIEKTVASFMDEGFSTEEQRIMDFYVLKCISTKALKLIEKNLSSKEGVNDSSH